MLLCVLFLFLPPTTNTTFSWHRAVLQPVLRHLFSWEHFAGELSGRPMTRPRLSVASSGASFPLDGRSSLQGRRKQRRADTQTDILGSRHARQAVAQHMLCCLETAKLNPKSWQFSWCGRSGDIKNIFLLNVSVSLTLVLSKKRKHLTLN